MNKILIAVVLVVVIGFIGFLVSTLEAPEPLEEDPVAVAEAWVLEEAATFAERGGAGLKHMETTEIEERLFEVTFTFESAFAGYGPTDEDEVAAQVITPHTIVVTVEEGEVIGAIVDEKYDEISEEMIEEPEEEPEEDTVTVNVYFAFVEEGVESVRAVQREFSVPQDIRSYTLNELLEGPTQEEEEQGYSTAIDEETTLLSLHLENGVAYSDFSSELDASGSAIVTMIREQIAKTLTQFDAVDEVVISIEGESEDILQP